MGSPSNEFWNVLDATDQMRAGIDRTRMPLVANGMTDVRLPLQAIVHSAAGGVLSRGTSTVSPPEPAVLNTTGGIVYFPPGIYLIGRDLSRPDGSTYTASIDQPDLVVWPNVQLWFAPGAVLALPNEVVVRVDGSVRADARQLFSSVGAMPGRRPGRVVFRSSLIREVYPEWWGAASLPSAGDAAAATTNSRALDECVRAAHSDRSFRGSVVAGSYQAIPIVFQGSYVVAKELVIQPLEAGSDTTTPNYDGVILLGRRATGSAGQVRPALKAGSNFSPLEDNLPTGRALLRIKGLHGSRVEGMAFDARITDTSAGADSTAASVCVQITGNNARSSTFRDCAFNNAKHVLVQVGDYIIERTDEWWPVNDRRLPSTSSAVNGGWDLSGLTFENCSFTAEVPPALPRNVDTGAYLFSSVDFSNAASRRRRIVGDQPTNTTGSAHRTSGLVFYANNTLPMILDHCVFSGPMAACIEAYSGALIIRGGTAQNELWAPDYVVPDSGVVRRDRPRGGVDIFVGDLLLPARSTGASAAASATAITVLEFTSQSRQFLDTFRHFSASSPNVGFGATLLQNVSHDAAALTDPFTTPTPAAPNPPAPPAPAAIYWSGPGLWNSPVSPTGLSSTLTLVSCSFAGFRQGTADRRNVLNITEPSGVVVVEQLARYVADVGTSAQNGAAADPMFSQVTRLLGTITIYAPVVAGSSAFHWYYKM